MKIAIVGACGTGKTTIVNELRKVIEASHTSCFIDEVARTYLADNPCAERGSIIVQGQIQDISFHLERIAHESSCKFIVCDRSVLDPALYLKTSGNIAGSDILLNKAVSWLRTYDHFFLADPDDIVYEYDPVRNESLQFRAAWHNNFLEMFSDLGIGYIPLSGTVSARLRALLSVTKIA